MLATAIVVFREIFEISLILGIILAATSNLPKKGKYVSLGILIGTLLSGLLAVLFDYITAMANGFGQEIVNIIILSMAILMISYTVLWMNNHAKELSMQLKETTQKIISDKKPYYLITIIIASTILREGTEIILFLNGLLSSGVSFIDTLKGSLIGLICGSLIGVLICNGLIKFPVSTIFKITSILLIFLAASMASELANLLQAINFIDYFTQPLWDSSDLISNFSFTGKLLKSLIGYNAQPSGIELTFYLSTILILFFMIKKQKNNKYIKY